MSYPCFVHQFQTFYFFPNCISNSLSSFNLHYSQSSYILSFRPWVPITWNVICITNCNRTSVLIVISSFFFFEMLLLTSFHLSVSVVYCLVNSLSSRERGLHCMRILQGQEDDISRIQNKNLVPGMTLNCVHRVNSIYRSLALMTSKCWSAVKQPVNQSIDQQNKNQFEPVCF